MRKFYWLNQFLTMPRTVWAIHERLSKMALDVSKLQADVQAQTDAVNSAVTLLNGLTQAIADLKNQTQDPAAQAAIDDLAAKVEAATSALSQAVVQNTPAAT